jgi:hypothetical protein
MGLPGSKKKAQQREQEAQEARKRERDNLEYTIRQKRGYIEKSERNLAEARAQGDKRREAAGQRVLNTWEDGLARDLTRLHRLQ